LVARSHLDPPPTLDSTRLTRPFGGARGRRATGRQSGVVVDNRTRCAAGAAIVVVALVLVGWLVSTVDSGRGLAQWDQALADWSSQHASARSTGLWKAVTRLGSALVLIPAMSAVALVDWRRRRDARTVLFLAVVGIGGPLLNNLIKLTVDRDRPAVVHLVDAAGQSFPSGHSAAAASCWLAMALVARRWSRRSGWLSGWPVVLAVAVAVVVALSRTMLGVHWLTDVVAGLVVGWSWCLLWAVVLGIVGVPRGAAPTAHDLDATSR
jgi:membrane-associated phospholipid phosphatase